MVVGVAPFFDFVGSDLVFRINLHLESAKSVINLVAGKNGERGVGWLPRKMEEEN